MTQSDGELLARVRAGDDRAFTLLVRRYRHVARRAALRVTRGHAGTEDVVQDALLQAYRHLDRFEGRSTFGSWLFRVTTNAALMDLRSVRRHARASLEPKLVDVLARGRELDVVVGDRELAWHAARAVNALPEPDRSVFIRSALEQAPLGDVARELDLTVSAVKSRLHRTRNALRVTLANALGGDDPTHGVVRGNRSSY